MSNREDNTGIEELDKNLEEVINYIIFKENNIIIKFNTIKSNIHTTGISIENYVYLNDTLYKYNYGLYLNSSDDEIEAKIRIQDIDIPFEKILRKNTKKYSGDYYWYELPKYIQKNISKFVYDLLDNIEEGIKESQEGVSTYYNMLEEGWLDDD